MGAWGKRDDMVVHEDEPYNAEPPRTALAGSPLTPVADFYSRNHGPVPDVDRVRWRLRVDGLLARPGELSLTELQRRFPQVTQAATLQCAGNRRAGFLEVRDIPGEDPWGAGATSTAEWTGVRLVDVLADAGLPDDGAEELHVAFGAPDVSELADPPQAFGGSVPLDKARGPEVLLAWAMNGEPLTRLHGAPLRVVVPGWIGARSVKWVDRVTVQRTPSDNFFQATAYRLLPPDGEPAAGAGFSLGPVALNADVLSPDDGATVPAGAVAVTGYAYAGEHRSVVRVDVSTDGEESWTQAEVDRPVNRWTWQHWRTTVQLPRGPATVVARAWDSTGALQPESAAQLWNPKGYVNNSWARIRLDVR